MKTLLLDTQVWDLCKDASGNMAVAREPYSYAQDAASAIKLFAGELYYNTTKGIPYFEQILGKFPSVALMTARFEEAALTVPGVVSAKCYISDISGRKVTGQVQVTDKMGNTSVAGF